MNPSWVLPILLLICSFPFSVASGFSGEVVGILDGDTIEVLHNGKAHHIRLYGIDCPEKKQPFGEREAGGFDPQLWSARHRATCRQGSIWADLGTVELTDGTNLNYALVQQGWC